MNHFSADSPLFIGIDGGGSGCRARLADGEGRVLGEGSASPAAVRLGIDCALKAIEQAARAAARNAKLSSEALNRVHAGVGLAGIGRKSVLEELNSRSQPFRSIVFVNDATIACMGAHQGRDGGVVIAGTGSVALAVVNGREIRIGGYGFPISDEGSGADIGLRAVRCALRASDGRIAGTNLTRELMDRFNNDAFEAVAWADRANATDYAKLAPLVMEHAEHGDKIASAIVRHASEEIDTLARALAERGVTRIALVGGLAPRLLPWLASDVRGRLVPSRGDALDGALALARQAYFHPRQPLVQTTLKMKEK